MKGKHIILAGGTGFVGQEMAKHWAVDNKVTILTRNIKGSADNSFGEKVLPENVQLLQWDGKNIGDWATALEGSDIVINLAGRSVNCRYNDANKAEILNSRVDATRVLGKAVSLLHQPPELFINVASATIYRHAEDRPQDEATGEIGEGFSVEVCKAWEQAMNETPMPRTRKVILRMAIVFGHGGVLVPYSWLARLGIGGKHSNGRQMFSWIHIDDVLSMVEWLYEHKDQKGTYNASAPDPLPNKVFMKLLRNIYHMPLGIPAPSWLLEIAAFIHRTETELLLKSRWVIPARLQKAGFTFKYSKMKEALENLLIK